MIIDIKELLIPTLERIASENGLRPEIYARNIVESFLESQYRGEVIDKFKHARLEDLKIIKDNKLGDLKRK
jgi:hypothetical protein